MSETWTLLVCLEGRCVAIYTYNAWTFWAINARIRTEGFHLLLENSTKLAPQSGFEPETLALTGRWVTATPPRNEKSSRGAIATSELTIYFFFLELFSTLPWRVNWSILVDRALGLVFMALVFIYTATSDGLLPSISDGSGRSSLSFVEQDQERP